MQGVLCGDAMDRGGEALQMQELLLELLQKDQLIYIRGDHEDLPETMIYDVALRRPVVNIHERNGTWDTAVQLSGLDPATAVRFPEEVAGRVRKTLFCQTLVPAAVDYFETPHYVFVHGWIPCYQEPPADLEFDGRL